MVPTERFCDTGTEATHTLSLLNRRYVRHTPTNLLCVYKTHHLGVNVFTALWPMTNALVHSKNTAAYQVALLWIFMHTNVGSAHDSTCVAKWQSDTQTTKAHKRTHGQKGSLPGVQHAVVKCLPINQMKPALTAPGNRLAEVVYYISRSCWHFSHWAAHKVCHGRNIKNSQIGRPSPWQPITN